MHPTNTQNIFIHCSVIDRRALGASARAGRRQERALRRESWAHVKPSFDERRVFFVGVFMDTPQADYAGMEENGSNSKPAALGAGSARTELLASLEDTGRYAMKVSKTFRLLLVHVEGLG